MFDYLKLMRVKHYIKNFLVFAPLFFSKKLSNADYLKISVLGMISFCFISSSIYIFNDICDAEKDRLHPTKKSRPIASGKISKDKAWILFGICFILSVIFTFMAGKPSALIYIVIYFVLNFMYSSGLKIFQ